MTTAQLDSIRRMHFVGIAGIGMSALARHFHARGYAVSGSDRSPGDQGPALASIGIPVYGGHDATQVDGADLVVVTSAVREDNPEVREARRRGIPVMKRAEVLGAIVNAGPGIAVAGTHGKTTTSTLIGVSLIAAGLDPTILVGGISLDLGSNARHGGDLVVAEADEYDASFLQIRPSVGVITNVEADHLDFYGTFDGVKNAFRRFAQGVRDILVICADDPHLPELVRGAPAHLVTYGLGKGDWRASDIEECGDQTRFRVDHAGRTRPYAVRLAGTHHVQNALAAIAVADALGADVDAVTSAIASFRGVERRLQERGTADGVLLIDDYAHHPTEIEKDLTALASRYGRPIRAVFQPHTYSRTKSLLQEFAVAFTAAANVYLMDVYPARETDSLGISGRDLWEAVRRNHQDAEYTETAAETVAALLRDARSGDIIVTMGAGDIYALCPLILEGLRQR